MSLALLGSAESHGLGGSSSAPSGLHANDATAPAAPSPGTFSGRPCDPYAFRRLYPHRWREFLRAHFRNATDVEMAFSIDDKTARNWWHGKTGPQGWAVEYARQNVPGAASWMEAA